MNETLSLPCELILRTMESETLGKVFGGPVWRELSGSGHYYSISNLQSVEWK
jgi:hypothetical protein